MSVAPNDEMLEVGEREGREPVVGPLGRVLERQQIEVDGLHVD